VQPSAPHVPKQPTFDRAGVVAREQRNRLMFRHSSSVEVELVQTVAYHGDLVGLRTWL
jgi:hypothetical protein